MERQPGGMRSGPLRRLIPALVVAALVWTAGGTLAQQQPPAAARDASIELGEMPRLVAGQAARVPVIVEVSDEQQDPLIVTFRARGGALDVVRERLHRQDAEQLERPEGARRRLRFLVPVFGADAGSALVDVRVDTYACRRGTCSAVRASASAQVQVHPADS